MSASVSQKFILFIRDVLPSLYFSLILFGQVFISSLANILSFENRISMIVFRGSIMALSYGFIFLNLRKKTLGYFSNLWVVSILVFWSLYLVRIFIDVYIYGFELSMPAWELMAWSWGSSLPIAICTYLYAAQNNLNFILFKAVRYGIFMLAISIMLFIFKPGLEQGAFYLEHLNPIVCANAGCALFLLCFSRVLIQNIENFTFSSSGLITLLGISIGLFIGVYSATRGVILAIGLIVVGSLFCLRSHLRASFLYRWKYIASFVASLFLIVLSASLSTRLLLKLFTVNAPETILIRLELWRASILEFINNPVFGAGFRMHQVLDNLNLGSSDLHYPHNYLLESLSIGGIILTIPLLYSVFSPAIDFHRNYKIELSILPICLLSIQAFIYSMHNGHLGDIPFFWMMIGIMAGTKYRLEKLSL